MKSWPKSHYDWLHENLDQFTAGLGLEGDLRGLISAHGDKTRQYRDRFEAAGLHWFHGAAIYLMTYLNPWAKQVRETPTGWVDVCDWICANKEIFLPHLPAVMPGFEE